MIFITGVDLCSCAALNADVPVLVKPVDVNVLKSKVQAILAPPGCPPLQTAASNLLG